MKLCYLIAFMLTAVWSIPAQTNTPAAPGADAGTNATQKLTITCDGPADFFYLQRQAIYRTNVVVLDPQFRMTCEWLTAKGGASQITNIVAITNVVIDIFDPQRGTNHVTADRAEYVYQVINQTTNDTLTLSGNAEITGPQGTATGDPIIWDRVSGDFRFPNGTGNILNKNIKLNPNGGNTNATPSTPATTNVTTTNHAQ